jgi:hypothetical protein
VETDIIEETAEADDINEDTLGQVELESSAECYSLDENDDSVLTESEEETEQVIRRSSRVSKMPKRFDDYEMSFVALNEEQITYQQAVSGQNSKEWNNAIKNELDALERNATWIETDLPNDKKAIEAKWVFRVKNERDKEPVFKARLVAKGFQQDDHFDHSEIFAPVAKLPTLRILLAIANKYKLSLHQMDVKSAFLYSEIDEEVYLKKPEGLKKDGKVLKLKKSLYGLKKAPKMWNETFNEFMIMEGFKRSQSDYCLYHKGSNEKFYVLLYVDDLIIAGEDEKNISRLKRSLKEHFEMKDLNKVSKYLGINIIEKENSIELDQKDYILEVLRKYNMENCNPVATPIESKLQISREPSTDNDLIKNCRILIGRLMYIMMGTRPDICFALSYLSRHQSNGNEELWKALKRILRYLKGTLDFKLIYEANKEIPLVGYTDADWAGDHSDRKSTSGFIMQVYGCTVSWCSNKQQCVSLSSAEAEYIALSKGIAEGCWIKSLLNEIGLQCKQILMLEDNQSAICVSKNPEHHKRLKHIDLRYHYIRDNVRKGVVDVTYIPSREQLGDICTKGLNKNIYLKLCTAIGLRSV